MQQDGETGSGSDDTILKKPVLAALAAVGFLALLGSLVGATTIGPGRVTTDTFNTTDTEISFNDNLTLNDNNLTGGEIVEADQFTTVHNTSLKAIDEAIDEYDYVKLRPTTYTGDTTITINTTFRDTVTLDAQGAAIDYTGSDAAIEATHSPNVANNERGRPVILLSDLLGPQQSNAEYTGSRGVKFVDITNGYIDIKQVDGFEYQVYLRNVDCFSEVNEIDIHDSRGGKRVVQLDGASVTGGSGTDSFRGTDIELRNADTYWSNDSYLLHQNGFLTGGQINIEGFAQSGGDGNTTGWFINHSIKGAHIERFNLEGDGHAIEFGSNSNPGEGLWMNAHLNAFKGKKFINTDDKDLTFIKDGSLETGDQNPVTFERVGDPDQSEPVLRAKNGSMQVRSGTKGSFNDFLDLRDFDGTSRMKIQNGNNIKLTTEQDQNFIFRHGGSNQDVLIIDSDGLYMPNGPIDMNNNNIVDAKSIDGGGDAVKVEDSLNVSGGNLILGETGVDSHIKSEDSDSKIDFKPGGVVVFESTAGNDFGFEFKDGNNNGLVEIETDGNLHVKKNNLNMNSNNITMTQMHNLTQTSGDLPACDSGLSGAVMYNGSGHYGCHSSSWNKLY